MSESRDISGDDQATEDRVGTIWRFIGVVALFAGLGLVGLAVKMFIDDAKVKTKGIAFIFIIGLMISYMGITWIRGKKYFKDSDGVADPASDDRLIGRFENWPEDCQPIIDRLRPSLLETGARFDFDIDDPELAKEQLQTRIGWSSNSVLAVLRPATDGEGLELTLRVGPDAGLISRRGPLLPSDEGGDEAAGEFGKIVLRDKRLRPELYEWIEQAAEFTRELFKSERRARRRQN